jgi:hypothetical protein
VSRHHPDGPPSATVEIDGIRVDTRRLLSISHRCRPQQCRARIFCCSHYDVCVNGRELERIIGRMPDAAKLCPQLRSPDGLRNVFEELEADLYAIDTDDAGLCVFAYHRAGQGIRCALHAVAAARNLPLITVKPSACILWPLALAGDTPVWLTVQSDAFSFPCNRRRIASQRRLDSGIADCIQAVFGESLLAKIRERIAG